MVEVTFLLQLLRDEPSAFTVTPTTSISLLGLAIHMLIGPQRIVIRFNKRGILVTRLFIQEHSGIRSDIKLLQLDAGPVHSLISYLLRISYSDNRSIAGSHSCLTSIGSIYNKDSLYIGTRILKRGLSSSLPGIKSLSTATSVMSVAISRDSIRGSFNLQL